LTGTPVAEFILIHPGVQFKAIERDALLPDRNFNKLRANLLIESVTVHAQVIRRVAQPQQAGQNSLLIDAGHDWSTRTRKVRD